MQILANFRKHFDKKKISNKILRDKLFREITSPAAQEVWVDLKLGCDFFKIFLPKKLSQKRD